MRRRKGHLVCRMMKTEEAAKRILNVLYNDEVKKEGAHVMCEPSFLKESKYEIWLGGND